MNKRGFSLLEFLCALFCFSIISLFLVNVFILLHKMPAYKESVQDIISTNQLIHIFNQSNQISTDGTSVFFNYRNRDNVLSLVNDKVIISPGVLIYFIDTQEVYFEIDQGKLYITIIRLNRSRKYLIGFI